MAKECFTLNDKALASRPTTVAAKHMGYGYAVFGFAPYSPFWRKMRKIVMFELLSNRRLDTLKHVQVSEVDIGIQELYKLWVNNNSDRELDFILDGWLKEHRDKPRCTSVEAKSTTDTAANDFIDVMLLLQEDGRLSSFPYDADTSIKSTCLFSKPVDDQPIDLTESPGLTIPKATPLDVLIAPHLSANLYNFTLMHVALLYLP
ncbi:Cytochrome 82C2 [Capsicum chinense]|nr:Cytochrome 82C2 [Capsicum chinense]